MSFATDRRVINTVSHDVALPLPRLTSYLAIVAFCLIALAFDLSPLLSQSGLLFLAIVGLGILLVGEVTSVARHQAGLWLVNPVVVASFIVFGLGFFLPGIVLLVPIGDPTNTGFPDQIDYWITRHTVLALTAALAMWLGYRLSLGSQIAATVSSIWSGQVLRQEFFVRPTMVVALYGISVVSRWVLIDQGVYGYSSTTEDLDRTAEYREYLSAGAGLGKLVLVALSLAVANPARPRTAFVTFAFASVLLIEIGLGVLSGFKSAVVLPLIIAAIAYYVMRKRFSLWMIIAPITAVMVAYAVIEPFRVSRHEDATFEGKSAASIAMLLVDSARGTGTEWELGKIPLQLLTRSSVVAIGADGIRFADTQELPSDAPAFLADLVLFPMLAFVPRFLWDDKPLQALGAWYNEVVLGNPFLSSVGMGPITYLYFAGGIVGVILGFLIIGIMQRAFFEAFAKKGSGGLLLAIAILPVLGTVDSYVPGGFIWLTRYLAPLLVLQFAIFRR